MFVLVKLASILVFTTTQQHLDLISSLPFLAKSSITHLTPTMARLKVLICGAGVAGNALASWLTKADHDVTVVERYPDLRVTGLQVDLRGPGIEVLKKMGLDEGFRAHAAKEQGLQVVSSSGRQWAYFPANKSGEGPQSFTSDYEIMRGDLTRLLYGASKAKVLFGISLESYEDKGDSVEVLFSDGRTEQFDLYVLLFSS